MATSSNPDKPAKSENPDKPTISQDTEGASPEMAESGISTKPEGKEGSTKPRLVLREFAGKPFWDWLDLFSKLAIPVVVLIVTIWFSLWQSILAGQQHKADMTRALDEQQAAILDTYIGTMRNLLLNHALSTSRPGDEVRQVAREQTLVTLLRLNAKRNRTVLQFLQDAHLFGTADAIINLSNADLSKAALDGAHLGGVTLIGADLSHTDLSGADLSGAVMYGANLAGQACAMPPSPAPP